MIVYASQIGTGGPRSGGPQGGGPSLGRWLGALVLGVFGFLIVLAVAVAATAAAVIGLIVAAAMLVLRLIPSPRPKRAPARPAADDGHPLELEARRTPDGWVAEAAPRPR